MEREGRGGFGAHPLLAGGLALALALGATACGNRLEPGQTGPVSYAIGDWQAVGEERVGRTVFQYTLRGTCRNVGADSAGAAGLAISRSPHTVVVEEQIRCGPLARGEQAPSLDTITVRHDRSQPFDPTAITGLVLVWGPETLERETRADRTRFDYEYYAYLINGTDTEQDLIATVESRSPDIAILDDTVTGRVPAKRRLASTDRFSFRHDRARPYDPNALEWRLRLGALGASADLDRDGDVDADDQSRAEGCVGQDPRRVCECGRADLDGDGDVDAGDVALAIAQLGRTGLPVPAPDTTPPTVLVTDPAAGSSPGAPPIPVSGTASEPLFLLLVNGVAATIGSGDPLPWSAQAPLPAGGSLLVVQALDAACNRATVQIRLAGADTTAPQVAIVAPAQVAAGRALRVAVDTRDAVGVAAVELFADGTSAGELGAPPHVYDLVAPSTPGAMVALRVVARDAAGNTGEASASVAVVDEGLADAPPQVTALRLPPSAAPGAALLVGADAADDRGVAEVRFAVAGGGAASDPIPPYEALLPVPGDAPVGARLRVDVVAVDGAGQTAAASGEVTIVAAADTSAPTVSLSAPATAAPGPPVRLAATASDDVGVASVRFLADGVPVAEDAELPFAAGVPLPAGRAPGEIVVWTALARDFAGNQAESDPAVTLVVAPGGGIVVGEVYDDATSRPLAGARVQVLEAAGAVPAAPLEALSDARGAWRLPLPEGRALLRIDLVGYTGALREVEIPASGAVAPLDARLTRRAAPQALLRSEGGTVLAPGGAARVEVPIGALAADGPVGLTALGAQSLPIPLPLGWTPIAAFELETPSGLVAPVSLAVLGEAARAAPVAARFDPQARAWRRLALDAGAPALPRVALAAPGVVALARPDGAPAAPPTPEVGALLAGVAEAALPGAARVELLPSPRVVFAAPDARADVAARLTATAPVPSGTPIEVRFREAYEQRDGSRLAPDGSAQDFLLYAEPEGPTARFAATPLPGLDPVLLDEGAIDLVAGPRPAAGPAVLGPEGGPATTPEGVRVELLPGALPEPTPIGVVRVDAADLGLASDARFTPLGGFDLELGGASLASAAVLRFPLSESPAAGDQILLVREITVLGRSELELVGVATPDGAGVLVGAGGLGLPLPGVRAGGRHALVRPDAPVGFATGAVVGSVPGVPEAIVRTDALPFVSRTGAEQPEYALAVGLSPTVVRGLDLARGDEGTIAVDVAAPGAVERREIVLGAAGPVLLSSAPADGASGVGALAAVSAVFSRSLDPASLGGGAISLVRGASPVPGRTTLSADGATVHFTPDEPFASDTEYELVIRPALRDRFGNAFRGDEADGSQRVGFRTADVTPPPRPEAGQVTTRYEDLDRLSVSGTQGAAEPGSLITATNESRGTTVSVLAGADGSFALAVDAAPREAVTLVYADAAGNRTEVPIARPVVIERLELRPAAMLFLELPESRPLEVIAHRSDGSASPLAAVDLEATVEDPTVAAVEGGLRVRGLTDGSTRVSIGAGEAPYRQQAVLDVAVRTQGERLLEQTVGAEGAELVHESGLEVRIPAGALAAPTPITVERIPLDRPLAVDLRGTRREIAAIFRFKPDIAFAQPIEIALPYVEPAPGFLGPDDGLLALRASTARLDDLRVDDVSDTEADDPIVDHEHPLQWFDREDGIVRLLADHFSYRVLMRVQPTIANATDLVLEQDGVRVAAQSLPGTQSCYATKTHRAYCAKNPVIHDKFVVWHATNAGLLVNVQVQFPDASWVGRQIELTTEPPLFPGACRGCKEATRRARVAANRRVSFQVVTSVESATFRWRRNVAGTERTFTQAVDFDAASTRTVTQATSNDVLAGTIRITPSPASQNAEVEGALDNFPSAQFYVNSFGKIIQLYPSDRIVVHVNGNFGGQRATWQSVGIEIQHTGYENEFYSGPQVDGVVALTDHLLQKHAREMLRDERGKRRRPSALATSYPSLERPSVDYTESTPRSNLAAREPVITHTEQDRDYGSDRISGPGQGACGSVYRKRDPCGEAFELEGLVSALSYDFPGAIVTRGGDLGVATASVQAARGGDVVMRWGQEPSDAGDEMHLSRFQGIPGGQANSSVELFRVDAGQTVGIHADRDDLGNVVIHGMLALQDDVTLRVSGTFYLAPGGRIESRKPGADGANLKILAAGPVVLHGIVDLSGEDRDDQRPGNGGRFEVRTRARGPLQVPSIVTQGGDVLAFDEAAGPSVGRGGRGGDVTIEGPAGGLIVLSGMKEIPATVTQCAPFAGTSPLFAGLRFPVNFVPRRSEVVPDGWRWDSGFSAVPDSCPGLPDFNPNRGLARTLGRGIVTSGGLGGSARAGRTDASPIVAGAPGGDGGAVDIGFPNGAAGAIRFRGVSIFTGGGTGTVRTTVPVAFQRRFEPNPTVPLTQLTGSAGGKGSTPKLTTTERTPLTGEQIFISKVGGDGGAGGAAGRLRIDPSARLLPRPQKVCTRGTDLLGHDGGIPKDEPLEEIGRLLTFCGPVNTETGTTVDIDSVSLPFALQEQNGQARVCPGNCSAARLLGGSGGLPGGGFSNQDVGSLDFEDDGTAGRFGPRGGLGELVVPQDLLDAIP